MTDEDAPLPSSFPSSASEVGKRVREVATLVGGVPKLAEMTELSESQIYRYVGGAELRFSAAWAIANAGGKTLDWLAEGPRPLGRYTIDGPTAGYANIPLYDVRARGGSNGIQVEAEHQVNELAFREDWIRRELRVSPKDLRLIHVEGDSMEPDLRSGDIILVDHTDTAARREGVYVIRMDNALLVKALQRLPGGVIKVTSRNLAYDPFNVNAADVESSDEFSIIGRVVWACRRF